MAAARRRLSPNAVALLTLAVIAVALLAWQRPWTSSDTYAGIPEIPADASVVLASQFRELSDATDESAFTAAFGQTPAAEKFARRTWASLDALDARAVTFRYISGGEVADRDDGSAEAVAEVSWQPGESSGLRPDVTHRSSVAFRVAPQVDGSFAVVGAAPRTHVLPIWLMGVVTVERAQGTVVISVDGGQTEHRIDDLATTARATVRRTIPQADGTVVVISPRTRQQMAQLVGQPVYAVTPIAAVTTHLDVTEATARDAVIVLNPVLFTAMDQRAAQIVVSHEAVHQLTRAVGTGAETWVVEGFADFVALRDDTADLLVSAGQILQQVKAGDIPRQLPDAATFDAAGHGLGAAYESAWLIFKTLAEDHDAAAMVDFYNAVIAGQPVEDALREELGLTQAELLAKWQNYLTKSASTVS